MGIVCLAISFVELSLVVSATPSRAICREKVLSRSSWVFECERPALLLRVWVISFPKAQQDLELAELPCQVCWQLFGRVLSVQQPHTHWAPLHGVAKVPHFSCRICSLQSPCTATTDEMCCTGLDLLSSQVHGLTCWPIKGTFTGDTAVRRCLSYHLGEQAALSGVKMLPEC